MDEVRDSLGRFAPGKSGNPATQFQSGNPSNAPPAATEFVRPTTVRAGAPGETGGAVAGGVHVQPASGDAGTGPTLTPANPAEYEGLSDFFRGVEYLVRRGTTIYPSEATPIPKPAGTARVDFARLPPEKQKIVEALVVMLKAQGWGYREIRKATGLGTTTVNTILRAARERDELKDVIADLDMDILPQAIDNIRGAIRKGDVDLSVKVAQGRGALVTHQKSTTMSANLTKLVVEYKTVPGEEHLPQPPLLGQIVGKPLE